MIAKHVPMTSARKSDFAELTKYIIGPQSKNERVGIVRVSNCHTEQTEIAMLEVLNIQSQNTRAIADKTYHLIVSFRAGETPDEVTLKAIEERLCAGLGFGDHQRVSVVHHDTDNLHMHIAINKIHPTRYTIHDPFNAYHTLGQLCDKLENDYGLEKDNHKASKVGSENRASDMERHAAIESLLGWIKRECKDQIQSAQSWAGLHQVLHEHGLQIHARANGLVITSESGVSVKASSVGREFSKAKLEARLGSFEPPAEPVQSNNPGKRYDQQPMRSRVNTVELHARYKVAQQLATTSRATEWGRAIVRKNRLIEDAKRNGRLKRAAIKLVCAPGIAKKLMYAATSKTLREDIAAINRQYFKARQEIYEKHQRRAWADWLRSEATAGDQEALAALRAREAATGLMGNTVGGQAGAKRKVVGAKHDSITKKGTVIYCVGDSAVRDDGDKFKVSRGADQAGLEAALRMAIARYGSGITVNGSAAFKEKIVQVAATANLFVRFDDDALERRRQQLAQAMTPKENKHGNDSNDGGAVTRRPDCSRNGGGRQAAVSRAAAVTTRAGVSAPAPLHGQRGANSSKPDARCAGQTPPPEARHGVRKLSELGVVHVTNRSEVLLPGHVPGHVEHQGTKPDHGVRRHFRRPGRLRLDGGVAKAAAATAFTAAAAATERRRIAARSAAAPIAAKPACAPATPIGKPNVARVGTAPPPASKDRLRRLSQLGTVVIGARPGIRSPVLTPTPGTAATAATAATAVPPEKSAAVPRRDIFSLENTSAGQAAADQYIDEREKKRSIGFDIPKHVRYNFFNEGTLDYAGIRQIEGQTLALLKVGEDIMVLPVDDATARRLKRMAVGQKLGVTAKGVIKTKGRSR